MATDQRESDKLKSRAFMAVIGAAILAVAIGVYRYSRVQAEASRLAEEAKLGPRVAVAQSMKTPPEKKLTLVGEARPYASVTLYAKVSGYLKNVKVDKGDLVKKDDLLAVIESPEIDKDYQGALADAKNKKAIAGRMNTLRARNLVSPQEADQANSDSEVSSARLDSLAVQKSYEILRAPFSGTVTSRYADPGALVQNAANSQTSALPVVTVSQVDRLRVYVYVDQRDAAFIQVGSPAQVTVAERPELQLQATVSRMSGELDPATKMLLTEVDVDNMKGQLVPGSFVQVGLVIHLPPYQQVPTQALVIQGGKNMIPVVDSNDTVHYREVKVGENDGQTVAITEGLQEGERVALNVGSNLFDGSHVRPIVNEPPKAPAAPAAAGGAMPKPTANSPAMAPTPGHLSGPADGVDKSDGKKSEK